MAVIAIDHVQLAAPPGCEGDARAFYGGVLGMPELAKPEPTRARGGCWFGAGAQELHIGVDDGFAPAARAHPGLVAADLPAIRDRLRAGGIEFEDDARIEGVDRLFVRDPFGNRLELRAA